MYNPRISYFLVLITSKRVDSGGRRPSFPCSHRATAFPGRPRVVVQSYGEPRLAQRRPKCLHRPLPRALARSRSLSSPPRLLWTNPRPADVR